MKSNLRMTEEKVINEEQMFHDADWQRLQCRRGRLNHVKQQNAKCLIGKFLLLGVHADG